MNNGEQFFNTAAGGYAIQRSLRFNAADSSFLSRTPASAGNRKTWTWAGWVKRSALGSTQMFFGTTGTTDATYSEMFFTSADKLEVALGYTTVTRIRTTQVFRDPSAWQHILIACDNTQAAASNRLRLYINGTEVTAFDSDSRSTFSNTDLGVNSTQTHYIGIGPNSGSNYLSAYLADVYLIDGQQLDPSSFGEFSATTGVWMPKQYTGTYGTNGFKLSFSDNSTAAALGTDTSGNGNTWTVNNLSVTAGAGNDSLVDVPTNGAQTDTGVGGEVRGNYCTWNPLDNGGVTLSNGNLDGSATVAWKNVRGTIAFPASGKWYFEVVPGGSALLGVGIAASNKNLTDQSTGTFVGYNEDGRFYKDGSINASGKATYTSGDVIGVAFDCDTNSVTFYKNNVSQGSVTPTTGVSYFPFVQVFNASFTLNAGARPFAYTAPSGFKALNTANLPAPVVTKPSEYMDVALWTGNATARSITGLNYSPDLVWIKGRSQASNHFLFDTVRGATNRICSSLTVAEASEPNTLTSFNSDGFSLGTDAGVGACNLSGQTYAAWAWDAGSSTVTNTAGSISSQVRANASAGFSVVTYTGTNVAATIGHGLGVAPELIICKSRSGSTGWLVYHKSLGNTNYLILNSTDASAAAAGAWNNTTPTSTVFTIGTGSFVNTNGATQVSYCFAPVAGYSSFGSYTGNGQSGDSAPFVWTGFRPRWLLVKNSNNTDGWSMWDAARDPYNEVIYKIEPNSSGAEGSNSVHKFDFLSNGFKVRGNWDGINGSGNTIIFAAFAEHPFQYARAR